VATAIVGRWVRGEGRQEAIAVGQRSLGGGDRRLGSFFALDVYVDGRSRGEARRGEASCEADESFEKRNPPKTSDISP
jgi:hypothetical protein